MRANRRTFSSGTVESGGEWQGRLIRYDESVATTILLRAWKAKLPVKYHSTYHVLYLPGQDELRPLHYHDSRPSKGTRSKMGMHLAQRQVASLEFLIEWHVRRH